MKLSDASLPVWERGLKSPIKQTVEFDINVAPRVGARIEIGVISDDVIDDYMSLPVWERGLKCAHVPSPIYPFGRSPCGSED